MSETQGRTPVTFTPRMSDAEIELRVRAYGDNGRFAEDLAFVWETVGEVMRKAELAYWHDQLGQRSAADIARFSELTGLNGIPAIAARFTETSAKRFVGPIDRHWVTLIAWEAGIMGVIQSNLPRRLLQRAAVGQARRRAVVEALDGQNETLFRIFNTLEKFSLVETDIISAEITAMQQYASAAQRSELGAEFEGTVQEIVLSVAAESQSLQERSDATATSARGMMSKTSEVAAAAEQSALAMREAAQNAGGLIRAIERARSEVEAAADIATKASEQSVDALKTSEALSEHAKAIESILGLIRDIAGQTNLLALNATIEAARAGDAGRGFAVVAQEVKSLANQTARATDDIAAKIGAIQAATRQTLDANGSIRGTVSEVQHSAQRIREAMEEQARTVSAITSSVDETALAVDAMSMTVSAIRQDTKAVATEVEQLATGFGAVNDRFADLQATANNFATKVAA